MWMNSNPAPLATGHPRAGPPLGSAPASELNIDSTVPSPRTYPEKPTVYFVALKDHSVVRALGYWMELGTLHYVSLDYSVNQVTLDLIDREASEQLNEQQGIDFTLPLAEPS